MELTESRLSLPPPRVPTFKYANDMRITFETIRSHVPGSHVLSFNEWTNDRVGEIVRSISDYSKADNAALLELIATMGQAKYFTE